MRTTLSIIKADIGSIGGHVAPSETLFDTVGQYIENEMHGLLSDYYIGYTGDDIAILMAHDKGVGDPEVHRLAWDAFKTGTETAKRQGLYGAGQDLLIDAFSGNVKGLGPAVAEMEIDPRPNEPFLMFAADKTEPGAYNLPLYLAFADPMNTAGLLLGPELTKGFVGLEAGQSQLRRILIPVDHHPSPQSAIEAACAMVLGLRTDQIAFHLFYVGKEGSLPHVRLQTRPGWLARSMVPPMRSTLVLTTSIPTPRPDTAVTAAAGEKPGRKM